MDNNPSLKLLTVKASSWTLIGNGLNQIIRVASHLLLVRLLQPEDFGIMNLTLAFIFGLQMISDVGLRQNIIQHNRSEDPTFLQTAWTIQIIRSLLLWLLTFILAWPLSKIYQAPQVLWLLPFVGVSILFQGFKSTNIELLHKRMNIGKVITLETTCNFLGALVMIASAWKWQQVWTLALSGLVSSPLKTIFSHLLFQGPRMKLMWDEKAIKEIVHFGKWIFISTFTTFLASRLDLIILGLFLTKRSLGFYAIASNTVRIIEGVMNALSANVLLPVYSRLKQYSLIEMRNRIFRVRIALMCLTLPPLYILILWGQEIVNFIYPNAYSNVGWMIEIIAVGGVIKIISMTIGPILLAMGDSFRLFLVQLSRAIFLLIPMIISGYFYGTFGLIIAIALSNLINYPVLVFNIRRYGVWLPLLDFFAFAISALIIALKLSIK